MVWEEVVTDQTSFPHLGGCLHGMTVEFPTGEPTLTRRFSGDMYRLERFMLHGVSLRAYVLERTLPGEARRLLVQVALEGLKK